MRRIIPVAFSTLLGTGLLGTGCSTTTQVVNDTETYDGHRAVVATRGEVVDDSEVYEGRHAAAVTPVADHRPAQRLHGDDLRTDIQQSIREQLSRAGIFEGVVALDRADEGNEAEVIISPELLAVNGAGSGQDPVTLRVRVIEKTSRKTVLDEIYDSGGRSTRDGRAAGSLNTVLEALEEKLEGRYGQASVF
ncbi:MAG: hypothetical protein U9Q81_17345 [Pseudomonadota bacterium]|nr:hypothetical protein [Pseudomonadota bacterium]